MGKEWKQWLTFFWGGGGSKITADGDRSHEIKRHLLLGRMVMTNLDSIVKSRDISPKLKFLCFRVEFKGTFHLYLQARTLVPLV